MNALPQPCLVRTAARTFGDMPALVSPDRWLSFRELDRRVSERVRELATAAEPGAWVAVKAMPTVDALIEFLALLRAGFAVLPVNPALPDGTLQALLARHRIARVLDPADDRANTPAEPGRSDSRPERLEFTRDTPCTGILTSGSTAAPKVVVHGYRNHVLSAEGCATLIPLAPGDRYLLSLPWFHVAGIAILFRCLLGGATVVLGGRAEDPDFLRAMQISHVSMVEAQLRRLLDRQGPLPDLRHVLLGGGPVQPSLLARARERGLPVWPSYGLTETGSLVIVGTPDGRARVLPHRECRIAPDGEILLRGGTLFLGYLEAGGLIPATDAQGWFHTRDLGHWDDAGFRLIGRLDNQFISGGENVQPERIEDALRRHPAIAQAVVVPRPDADFGQRPVAFVDVIGDIQPDALRAWLRHHLSAWELPVAFHPLPRGDGLKVRRADLIPLAASDAD